MSDAGSAWTTLPPIVPRLRTCRSPIPRAHSPSAANAGRWSASAPMSSFHVVSGADVQLAVAFLDAAQVEPRDVDDEGWPRDAELHHRDERLPARDRLRVRLGEQLERVVEVGCARVARRGRDHDVAPTARIDSTMPW